MTQEAWLTGHPYLLHAAEFHAQVERALEDLPSAPACVPDWRDYEGEYGAGVPLLRSCCLTIDLHPVEITLDALIAKLGAAPLREKLVQDIRDLQVESGQHLDFFRRAVASLLETDAPASTHFGLLRYLGWTVMARYLFRVVDAFGQWRREELWLRWYCPMCGSLPAMAQLIGIDPGRVRLFSCSCCGTRWRYRRTGCPFCGNEDEHQLVSLVVEGEEDLRIDHCGCCGGYIKTYNGTGSESVLLADWTSLHLDIIARDHGLHRLAASLYMM